MESPSGRPIVRGLGAVAVIALGVGLGAAANASSAVAAEPAKKLGTVSIFKNRNFTVTQFQKSYSNCVRPATGITRGSIASFDNKPLPGCQVTLVNARGEKLILCKGRGAIKPSHRHARTVRVQRGVTPTCLPGPRI